MNITTGAESKTGSHYFLRYGPIEKFPAAGSQAALFGLLARHPCAPTNDPIGISAGLDHCGGCDVLDAEAVQVRSNAGDQAG